MENNESTPLCEICKKNLWDTRSRMIRVHTECIPKSADGVLYFDKNTVLNTPNDQELGAFVRNLYWQNKS